MSDEKKKKSEGIGATDAAAGAPGGGAGGESGWEEELAGAGEGAATGADGLGQSIPAGKFKAVCLSLMDRVKEKGVEYVITKRGKPVAKLVPVTDEVRPFIGRSRGVISGSREDLLAPIGADWEVDADL